MKLLIVNRDAVRSQALIDCFGECLTTLDLDAQVIAQAARIKANLITELDKPCIKHHLNYKTHLPIGFITRRECNECYNEIKKEWLK